MALSPALLAQIAIAYGYVAFWIAASAGVILFNKCASHDWPIATSWLQQVGPDDLFFPFLQVDSYSMGFPLPHHIDDVAHVVLFRRLLHIGTRERDFVPILSLPKLINTGRSAEKPSTCIHRSERASWRAWR